MASARIAAVVVNWNGGADNLRCLASLAAQTPPIEHLLFVDNVSSDGSPELVAAHFPRVEILRNATNEGYGGGNNQGIARALELGADYLLIVNNDVILPAGALAPLLEELELSPVVGIVGPRVLLASDPGRLWAAGGMITWRQNLTTLRGHLERDDERWRRTAPVHYVIGCCMLVRRQVFEKIGLFDADYFAYTEDVDFAIRAKRGGYLSRCVGSSSALHAPSSATGGGYNPRRKYMMGVNSIWFMRRYARWQDWCKFLVFDVLSLPGVWLAGVFRGRGKAVFAKACGIFDGLRGRRITADVVRGGSRWLW
jgi:GT2 family glycosyltransferase